MRAQNKWDSPLSQIAELHSARAKKAILSWSGGKDSALALHEIQNTDNYEIHGLLTTVNEDFERISIHGVRQILLEQQADSLGFPLEKVFISKKASLEEYESKMQKALKKYSPLDIPYVVFGDIFLEDVRKYRADQLSRVGMKGVFPLWKKDTHELAQQFIDLGFKAIITCVDSDVLEKNSLEGYLMINFYLNFHPTLTHVVRMENFIHSYTTDLFSEAEYSTH